MIGLDAERYNIAPIGGLSRPLAERDKSFAINDGMIRREHRNNRIR